MEENIRRKDETERKYVSDISAHPVMYLSKKIQNNKLFSI
jgi:hypothetical protein